jgi:hypothetical protein
MAATTDSVLKTRKAANRIGTAKTLTVVIPFSPPNISLAPQIITRMTRAIIPRVRAVVTTSDAIVSAWVSRLPVLPALPADLTALEIPPCIGADDAKEIVLKPIANSKVIISNIGSVFLVFFIKEPSLKNKNINVLRHKERAVTHSVTGSSIRT